MPPLQTASFNQYKRVPFENMVMVEWITWLQLDSRGPFY